LMSSCPFPRAPSGATAAMRRRAATPNWPSERGRRGARARAMPRLQRAESASSGSCCVLARAC
jgi:hypothetical protein